MVNSLIKVQIIKKTSIRYHSVTSMQTASPKLQTRIPKVKSAYNSLIICPRGLQCETNLSEIIGWESFYVKEKKRVSSSNPSAMETL